MSNKLDTYSFQTPVTGDQVSEQSVTRTVNFGRYEIEIELTIDGKFLGIVSIKIHKSFLENMGSKQISDVHDVEEYYNEE